MSQRRLRRIAMLVIFSLAVPSLLGGSSLPPGDQGARVRAFTRPIEFDFVDWTLAALSSKISQLALGADRYLPPQNQSQIVLDYLDLVREIQTLEGQVTSIYADPEVVDPTQAAAATRDQLDTLYVRQSRLAPLAETILQDQLQIILAESDFTLGGQPVPPILYHTTPPPLALIVSPRAVIRQDEHIAINPDLSTEEQENLEAQVEGALDVSSLVVPVGGIGLYPTMVMETSDINFLAEVVAHEWTHNFLTLRPLGMLYFKNPQLTTINETVANITGKELGRQLVARFYPDFLPPPPAPPSPPTGQDGEQPAQPGPPRFNFRAEMGETRRTVDALLAGGKVEEAEAYMEARRQVFWENGYRLRKINQAYFAFYGAYADQPGGASGADPVGQAVRSFRAQSSTLAEFVKRVSWVTSFESLNELVKGGGE
jgi:hypothetical protein